MESGVPCLTVGMEGVHEKSVLAVVFCEFWWGVWALPFYGKKTEFWICGDAISCCLVGLTLLALFGSGVFGK